MKKRKGFKRIIVDGVEYQYSVSLNTNSLIVYSDDIRSVYTLTPTNTTTWRGKHGDGGYGKREIAQIIREKQ